MKKMFSRGVIALLLFALSLPALTFAQQGRPTEPPVSSTSTGRPSTPARVAARRATRARTGPHATEAVEHDFAEALSVIEENYIDGAKLDYNTAFKSSIIGMLRSLDPHSNYYDREEFDELKTDQRSEYYGIGASIQNYTLGDQTDTYVAATFENTPAARGGLRFGDRIVEVDGQNMRGKSSAEVRDKIRGPQGSTVKVTVERAANGGTETIELKRDAVPQPSVPDAYLLRPGVGYIDMTHGFNYTTADELQAALDELHARGMTSLVLDLRGNPGGFLDQAIHVAEKFLRRGQLILTQKGRDGVGDRAYKADNVTPDTTPLVILVNGATASASEIVAGAMQDHDRALILGQTSFGKGLVQSIIPLDYGAGLTLTTAKYYTPSGRLIQRDYSNGDFYDYYTHGGSAGDDDSNPRPSGPQSRTDQGRIVYGGGGITPDDVVKPRSISVGQTRLFNPIFFFARELVNGRVKGFEKYSFQHPIDYNHALRSNDFPVSDALFKAFKDYVASQASWKPLASQLDRNRAFVAQELRYNLITAAYGKIVADRVRISSDSISVDDPQVAQAIEMVPRAKELAVAAIRVRTQP